MSTERGEFEIDLEEDRSDISGINVQSFVDEQEWRLHNHVETWKKVTTKVFQNAKYKHPALSAACKASRRPGFFIWNIFFVMVSERVHVNIGWIKNITQKHLYHDLFQNNTQRQTKMNENI